MADQDTKAPAPPYTAFASVKTAIGMFKEHGVPGRLDRSVLSNFSGAVGTQVIGAFKFLQLIDEDGHPKRALEELVAAYGTDEWPAALEKVLRHAFAPLFKLNLETASPSQFTQKFTEAFNVGGDTVRKAITFFVNAVREARIPISQYILKNKKPRVAPTIKRRSSARPAVDDEDDDDGDDEDDDGEQADERSRRQADDIRRTPYAVLMHEIYDPQAMKSGSEEERAVFTLARFLRTREVAK
jgi:hypothetical protein